jgi:CDP-glucose 4,6-dehydratase
MRSWSEDKIVEIRSPKATRPWQHVLEPLSGYLNLAFDLAENPQLSGESFNFGPNSVKNYPVERLLIDLSKCWDYKDSNDAYRVVDEIKFHEAGLLKLNCEKAFFDLKWEPTLNYEQLIDYTGNWYYEFYKKNTNMFDFTMCQIEDYEQNAINKEIRWTKI